MTVMVVVAVFTVVGLVACYAGYLAVRLLFLI